MAVELYLGNIPEDIIKWIDNHSQPGARSRTRVWWSDDETDYDDYLIEGEIAKNSLDAYGKSWSDAYKVEIGRAVTSIKSNAFEYCSSLTTVSISDTVVSLGNEAFLNCAELINVVIPGSVSNIGDRAFLANTSLANVTIMDGVMSIGDSVFSDCINLANLMIPDSVMSIGEGVFEGCSNSLFDTTTIHHIMLVDGWVVGNTITTTIENLDLDGVRGIAGSVFYYCNHLTNVTISNDVKSIGKSAFYGCNNMTSITIPDSIANIGDNAFADCFGIANVTIVANGGDAANVKQAMIDAINDEEISDNIVWTMPTGVEHAKTWYKYAGDTEWRTVMLTGEIAIIDDMGESTGQIDEPWNIVEIEIGTGTQENPLTSIGNNAFYGCNGLTSVMISNSVMSIGDSAFYYCIGLTNITIPNSVKYILANTFGNCNNLTNVTIPNGVTSIGNGAFYNCSELTSVTIPNSVTNIGANTFFGCTGLTSVIFQGKMLDEVQQMDNYPWGISNPSIIEVA